MSQHTSHTPFDPDALLASIQRARTRRHWLGTVWRTGHLHTRHVWQSCMLTFVVVLTIDLLVWRPLLAPWSGILGLLLNRLLTVGLFFGLMIFWRGLAHTYTIRSEHHGKFRLVRRDQGANDAKA